MLGGLNFFSYSGNNPNTYFDETGFISLNNLLCKAKCYLIWGGLLTTYKIKNPIPSTGYDPIEEYLTEKLSECLKRCDDKDDDDKHCHSILDFYPPPTVPLLTGPKQVPLLPGPGQTKTPIGGFGPNPNPILSPNSIPLHH